MRTLGLTLLLYFLVSLSSRAQDGEWRQFRGPNGQGLASLGGDPFPLERARALWTTSVAKGSSSPIILGDGSVAITGTEKGKLLVRRIERDGKSRWERSFAPSHDERTHPFTTLAASTPCSDGERIYAFFGSLGLVALDAAGNEIWRMPIGSVTNKHGFSSSPILHSGMIIQSVECEGGKSFLTALNATDGKMIWRKDRPLSGSGWATPVVWRTENGNEVVLLGRKRLDSYELKSGKHLWWLTGLPDDPITMPAISQDLLFISSTGYGSQNEDGKIAMWKDIVHLDANKDGKIQLTELTPDIGWKARSEIPDGTPENFFPARDDFAMADMNRDGGLTQEEWDGGINEFLKSVPKNRVLALRGPIEGDGQKRIVWDDGKGASEMPSPAVFDGLLFTIKDGGLLSARDASSGKLHFQERINAPGYYTASPVIISNGKDATVVVASSRGMITAVSAKSVFSPKGQLDIGEPIHATPAIDTKRAVMYVRGDKHLFAFQLPR